MYTWIIISEFRFNWRKRYMDWRKWWTERQDMVLGRHQFGVGLFKVGLRYRKKRILFLPNCLKKRGVEKREEQNHRLSLFLHKSDITYMHLDSYYLMTCIYLYNVMYIKESRDAFDKKYLGKRRFFISEYIYLLHT